MKKISTIAKLQLVIIIYSISSVIAKVVSKQPFFSLKFFFWGGLELVFLAVYAIFWQQMIKKIELSQAYANRAMVLVWSLLWAFFGFQEPVSIQNIIGALLVMAGIVVINCGGPEVPDGHSV